MAASSTSGWQGAWQHAKAGAAIVVTTVFIWLVADQYVREEQPFQIRARLLSGSPDRYVAVAEPPFEVTLDLMLSGRRKHLKEFADVVASRDVFEAIINPTGVSRPEPQFLAVENDVLPSVKELRKSRLLVKSVSPSSLSVIIDEYEVVRAVAIEPDYGDLKVTATMAPDHVSVRLPTFAAARLRADPFFRPDLRQAVKETSKAGSDSFELRVPVTFSFKDLAPTTLLEINPSREVTITGRVESQVETVRKGPIQITWSLPDEVQQKYVVVLKAGQSLRRDIDVTGPKGQVEQLQPQKIRGFVDVLVADEPGREIVRAVQYVLPEGFSLAANSRPHEVAFLLELRPSAAALPED